MGAVGMNLVRQSTAIRAALGGMAASLCLASIAAWPGAAAAETATPAPTLGVGSPVAVAPVVNGEGDFARIILERGGWPVSGENMCALVAWQVAEGGHFVPGSTTFNPLNTSQSMPGDSVFNSHGVRNYPDWETGIQATVMTLQYDFYTGIRTALASGNNAVAVLSAVGASPWGTKFPDVGSAVGRCSQWSAEFDRLRAEALVVVERATGELDRARARVEAARVEEARLNEQHRQMSWEIEQARYALGRFARRLYMSGMEPAVADQVDALTSGDPVSHELLKNYPRVVADRDSALVRRSISLLAEIETARQQHSQSTLAATAELTNAEARLAAANADLDRVADRVADLN